MAKLKQKLDRNEWSKLAADVQGLYIAKGDAYVLDTDDAEDLRNAFQRTKDELKTAQDRLEALKDIDPVAHKKLQEDAARAARQRDLDQGNFEKVLSEERAAHAKELSKRDEQTSKLLGQLNEALIDRELVQAISAYPGAKPKLIMPAAKLVTTLREVNGKFRAVVLDQKGEPRLKEGAKTADDYMGPVELVAEMRNDKEYAGAFPANAPGRDTTRLLIPRGTDGNASTADTVASIAKQVAEGATKLS